MTLDENMTLPQIAGRLKQEKTIPSRFPIRIIFTDNIDEYIGLEKFLSGICDVTANAADFCSAEDIVPRFERIPAFLKEHPDKHILMLSVGEYLRICLKRELNPELCQIRAFWEYQQSEASHTRIIMPVFGCRDIFSRIVGKVNERQQYFVWTLESESRPTFCTIDVYSPEFTEIPHAASNLTEWLKNWSDILTRTKHCSIITKFYRYVEESHGNISTSSYASPFVCAAGLLSDGDALAEEWCTGDFWSELFAFVSASGKQNMPLSEVIADALNMSIFRFVPAVSKWESLSNFQKTCVWLWFKVYSSDDHYSHPCYESPNANNNYSGVCNHAQNANNDYYSYVCRKAENPEEIPARVRDEILTLPDASPRWIAERNAALSAMSLTFTDEYFAILDSSATPAMRLQLLTYRTHEEKRYAVKVISEILREGMDIYAAAELVKDGYPELAAYMTGTMGCDSEIDRYFAWYRTHKLINRYSCEYGNIDLERFDSRYKVMNEPKSESCAYFWLDGFGAEYAPLLVHELRQRGITNIDVKIGTALLPTDTEHNHQWDESAPNVLKWNGLDTLAHKGVPDDRGYHSCVVKQLAFFRDAAKKAEELLGKYECVVITGDHGSSRLAALGFHDKSVGSVDVPEGWAVRNFGRYCELEGDSENTAAVPNTKHVSSGTKAFLVMNGYQHFSVSGNTIAGEVHGGNSPEERLVAVITITKSQPDIPELTCTPVDEYALRQKNRTEFELAFSRKITSLEVSAGHIHAKCSETTSWTWSVTLEGAAGNEIRVSVVADGMLLPEIAMKVKTKGITIKDDPFGGMSL